MPLILYHRNKFSLFILCKNCYERKAKIQKEQWVENAIQWNCEAAFSICMSKLSFEIVSLSLHVLFSDKKKIKGRIFSKDLSQFLLKSIGFPHWQVKGNAV